MSDYPRGDWQKIWDALFWRFMDVHRDFFLGNPRLGMLIKTFDKKSDESKSEIHSIAQSFLSSLDTYR
jgi:deoxyribodipyrimidine photolyase-related protein